MKKKNSTRLAKKPAVNAAVELAKEGGKKKKDVSIELQFQAYEGVLKDLSKENSELRNFFGGALLLLLCVVLVALPVKPSAFNYCYCKEPHKKEKMPSIIATTY